MKHKTAVFVTVLIIVLMSCGTIPTNNSSVVSVTMTASLAPTDLSVEIPSFLPVGDIEQIFQSTDSCQIPCWQGIHPSVTTENELYEKTDSLKLVVSRKHADNQFTWVRFEKNKYNLMLVILKNSVVNTITFYGIQHQTVENVNSILGNPQGLTCIYPVPSMFFSSLFYPNSGLQIDVMAKPSKDNLYTLQENSQVVFISFVQPYKLSEYLAKFQKSPNNIVIQKAEHLLVDWKGYGDYSYCECKDENLCKPPSK